MDEHCVAIFVSLHPSCIISATRSPQCADGDSPGALRSHELQGCNVVYHRVSSPLQVTPSQPSCSLPFRSITPGRRHGTQEKCNPTELWLNLGELHFGDFVGEERVERP